MARLPLGEIERLIYPVSFFRNKAEHVKGCCEALVGRFGGRVPSTLDELVTLSGRFERLMVIPGSIAVVVLGLLAAWALDQPLAGANNWWLLTSLLLFVAIGALVPIVFLPHGKVFEHEPLASMVGQDALEALRRRRWAAPSFAPCPGPPAGGRSPAR